RYHLDDEPFFHPLQSVQFDPDCPYDLPLSQSWLIDTETLQKGEIHLRKDPVPQEELVRYRSTLPLAP
ncbi:hypothetical protein PIB30_106351, partial [Stylosanthes scabra]|nr:hypothetical protein [Stylosanthes scabra]